jgi:hypothetical protein
VITAVGGGAEDAPADCGADHKGWHRIAEETLSRVFSHQGRSRAWRLLANADNSPRNDANLATIGINKFCAAARARHKPVTGVCFRTACRLLKSVTAVDQHLTFDRVHSGGESRTAKQEHRTQYDYKGAIHETPHYGSEATTSENRSQA